MESRYDQAGPDYGHPFFSATALTASTGSGLPYHHPGPYSRHNSYSEGGSFDSVWGFIQDVTSSANPFFQPSPGYPAPMKPPPEAVFRQPTGGPFPPTTGYRIPGNPNLLHPNDFNTSNHLMPSRPRTPDYAAFAAPQHFHTSAHIDDGYRRLMNVDSIITPDYPPRAPSPAWGAQQFGANFYPTSAGWASNADVAPLTEAHHYSNSHATASSSSSSSTPTSTPSSSIESAVPPNVSSSAVSTSEPKTTAPKQQKKSKPEPSAPSRAKPKKSVSQKYPASSVVHSKATAASSSSSNAASGSFSQLPFFAKPPPPPPVPATAEDEEPQEPRPIFVDDRERDQVKLKTLFRVDLGGYAVPTGVSKSLSKPVFAPRADARRFMLGAVASEEFQDDLKSKNQLIFFQFDRHKIRETPSFVDGQYSVPVVWKYSLADGVRDILWADEQHMFLALGNRITMVQLGADLNVCETCDFPPFHKDDVREMALRDMHLLLSGGFDGNVFVTDVVKLTESIRRNDTAGRNRVYRCGAVVGSVAWHPTETSVASCTTDSGSLRMFDVRTEKHSPALSLNTGEEELYCHAYRDNFTVLLGYGSGHMKALDYRMNKAVAFFEHTCLDAIGEIKWDINSGVFVCTGQPKISMWQWSMGQFSLWGENSVGLDGVSEGKTCGNFIRNTNLMGVTTSEGSFALLDYSGRVQRP